MDTEVTSITLQGSRNGYVTCHDGRTDTPQTIGLMEVTRNPREAQLYIMQMVTCVYTPTPTHHTGESMEFVVLLNPLTQVCSVYPQSCHNVAHYFVQVLYSDFKKL